MGAADKHRRASFDEAVRRFHALLHRRMPDQRAADALPDQPDHRRQRGSRHIACDHPEGHAAAAEDLARGMVTLYERGSETIFIHESFGLTDVGKIARHLYAGRGHHRQGRRIRPADHRAASARRRALSRPHRGRTATAPNERLVLLRADHPRQKGSRHDQRGARLSQPPPAQAGRRAARHARLDDRARRRTLPAREHRQGAAGKRKPPAEERSEASASSPPTSSAIPSRCRKSTS